MKRLFLLHALTLLVCMLGVLRVASADISLADFCASQSGDFSDSTCTLSGGGAISADTLILVV
jgi:predicted outer membrane repeat protein